MPRPNLSLLISEEMKKRFDDAIRDEISQFNQHHQDYLNRIEALDKYSKAAVEDVKAEAKTFSLFWNKQEKMYEEFKSYILEMQRSQSHTVKKLIKEVEAKLDRFHAEKQNFLRLDNVREEMREYIENMNSNVNRSVKELDNYKLVAADMWKKIDIYTSQQYDRLYAILNHHKERIDKLEKDLMTFRVDAEGVMRELQVYKKSMFIMEKKIEDLYDKLGRLK